jgi:hypothetical protein
VDHSFAAADYVSVWVRVVPMTRPVFCPTKTPPKLTDSEARVMAVISGATFDAPVSLGAVARTVGLTKRAVQLCVEELIKIHRVPIGAKRGSNNGYFIATTIEERFAAARPHRKQFASEARRVGVLLNRPDLLILAGQMEIELKEQERA